LNNVSPLQGKKTLLSLTQGDAWAGMFCPFRAIIMPGKTKVSWTIISNLFEKSNWESIDQSSLKKVFYRNIKEIKNNGQ